MGAHSLRFSILTELGLSETEAIIYELLLSLGPKRPPDLVEPSGIARGNVYNVLQTLQQKGLVTQKDKERHQTYEAVDPSKLRDLLTNQLERARRLESAFTSVLPQLTSTFNLSTGKPAMQVFEGWDGFEEALHDSLTAKTEILTYFDPAGVATGRFAEINKRYIKKRIQLNISKRIILPNTNETTAYVKQAMQAYTEIRVCPTLKGEFYAAMELYDNKVTFCTLNQERVISFIIEDPFVAALQRQQFEALWSLTSPLSENERS